MCTLTQWYPCNSRQSLKLHSLYNSYNVNIARLLVEIFLSQSSNVRFRRMMMMRKRWGISAHCQLQVRSWLLAVSTLALYSEAPLWKLMDSPKERGRRIIQISTTVLWGFKIRSRSVSPGAPATQRTRVDVPRVQDVDPVRRAERERQLAAKVAAMELEKAEKAKNPSTSGAVVSQSDAQAEFAKLVGSRSGGVYMPPARLRELQLAAASDKASPEYQRLSWDALRKSITGIVNRVNIANVKQVVPELFAENLIRGRGLFARSIMKAQAASLPFTPIFAALVAIINTKLPQVGELVLTRLISQFRRSFKRNDKVLWNHTLPWLGADMVYRSCAIRRRRSLAIWSIKHLHMRSSLYKFLSYSSNGLPMTQ